MSERLNQIDADIRADIEARAALLCNEWSDLKGGKGSRLGDKANDIRATAIALLDGCDFSPPPSLLLLLRLVVLSTPGTKPGANDPAIGTDPLSAQQRKAIEREVIEARMTLSGIEWGGRETIANAAGITVDALDKWRGQAVYGARRLAALASFTINLRLQENGEDDDAESGDQR